MFGDILIWVLTFFGLVPWDTLFSRKKDFQEQLAEFGDGPNVCIDNDNSFPSWYDADCGRYDGSEVHTERAGIAGPWGVVPDKCPTERDIELAIIEALCPAYTTRPGRR